MSEEAKKTITYSFRIPAHAKELTDKMSDADKADLNQRLRIELARKLHEMNFNPFLYLGE